MTIKPSNIFEVQSPWAEADPVPFRGISPRLESLEGKTVGLLRNSKRAAMPTLQVIRKKFKEKYPTLEFSEFSNLKPNEVITQQDNKDKFEDWLKGVDAVIAAYGD